MRGPGAWLGRLAALSAQRPWPVLAVVLVVTLAGMYGASTVQVRSEATDLLPEDDPHARAAENVSREFDFFFDQAGVYATIDPDRWAQANAQLDCRQTETRPQSAWDEVYIRGLDELGDYLEERVPALRYRISLAAIVKTINWTNSGAPPQMEPDPGAYALPATDCEGEARFKAAIEALERYPGRRLAVSEDNRSLELTLVFDPSQTDASRVEIGRQLAQAIEDYPEWARENGTLQAFDADEMGVEGLPVAEAQTTDLVREDLARLAPLALAGVLGGLAAAFRSWRATTATVATLGVAGIWTTGLLGWFDVPLGGLNAAYVPLVLGVGIDYAVHLVNATLARRADGVEPRRALRDAAEQVGVPTTVATLTTAIGLGVLAFSPSPAMAQVGLVGAGAVLAVYAATFTCLPALFAVLGPDPSPDHRPARLVPTVTGLVEGRRAWAGALGVLVLAAAGVGAASITVTGMADPANQLPADDPVREWKANVDEGFHGGKSGNAFFILQGDVQTPEAHRFVRALGNATSQGPLEGERVAHLPLVLEGYLTVRDGSTGAVQRQLLTEVRGENYDYPDSEREIRGLLDEAFASPYAPYTSFFAQPPDYSTTVLHAETEHGASFSEAQRVWEAMDATVAQAADETGGVPDDVQVTYYGEAAFTHLFVDGQLPWIQTLAIAVSASVTALAYAATRSLKASAVVLVESIAAGVLWLGGLAAMGIALSPLMFLPYVILVAVGTDDTLHLARAALEDREWAYRVVGKAVTVTTATAVAAFGVFAGIRHVSAADAMLATAWAAVVAWGTSVMLVVLVLGGSTRDRRDGAAGAGT